MSAKVEQKTYEDAVGWLRDHGFDLIEAPGAQTRVFLKKYNCSAAIQKTDDGGAKIFADRKSTRLNSSHIQKSRMPSSA